MVDIVIANAIALVASILMIYTGVIKQKEKIIGVQTAQKALLVLSNIILKGITGAIINGIGCIRNILCYKNKLGIKEKLIIIISLTILSVYFNNLGVIGLLPLISTIVYTLLMDTKNIIRFKLLTIITTILWFIYDFYIMAYTAALFDFLQIITNIIAVYELIKTSKEYKVSYV